MYSWRNVHHWKKGQKTELQLKILRIKSFFFPASNRKKRVPFRLQLKWSPISIWASDFSGPQEIWSPRKLGPNKFGPREIWALKNLFPSWKSSHGFFMQGPNLLVPNFLGNQISWVSNFSGTKKVRGQNEIGDHFSYSLLFVSDLSKISEIHREKKAKCVSRVLFCCLFL